jgi:predicted transcriptional regulator
MSQDHHLSDLQLAVMRVLWRRQEASVAQVHEDLEPERGLAPTTVATLLSRLERRGLLTHRSAGRVYMYAAVVSEQEVRRSMVGDLTDRLFQGDAAALVSHLLTTRDIAPGDRERVRALLAERDEDGENDHAD